MAVTNGCTYLVTAVDSFVEDNFSEITASSDFLEYSLSNVVSTISGSSFGGVHEKEIFKVVINWIEYDNESRSSNLETTAGQYSGLSFVVCLQTSSRTPSNRS